MFFLREIHPQIANLVRFWDRHLPLTEVQNTCVLCKGPIIRYTPVLGPHAPTSPLFCCRSLVHSACLNIYTRGQAGGRDQQVPCLFCDAPQVETHDWRAQEAWQHDPDVRSYLDALTPYCVAPDMSADLCWLTQRTHERTRRPLDFGEMRRLGLVPTNQQSRKPARRALWGHSVTSCHHHTPLIRPLFPSLSSIFPHQPPLPTA